MGSHDKAGVFAEKCLVALLEVPWGISQLPLVVRSATAVTVQEDEQRVLRRLLRVERDALADAKRQLAPCRPLEDLRFESGYDNIRDADESKTRKAEE